MKINRLNAFRVSFDVTVGESAALFAICLAQAIWELAPQAGFLAGFLKRQPTPARFYSALPGNVMRQCLSEASTVRMQGAVEGRLCDTVIRFAKLPDDDNQDDRLIFIETRDASAEAIISLATEYMKHRISLQKANASGPYGKRPPAGAGQRPAPKGTPPPASPSSPAKTIHLSAAVLRRPG